MFYRDTFFLNGFRLKSGEKETISRYQWFELGKVELRVKSWSGFQIHIPEEGKISATPTQK